MAYNLKLQQTCSSPWSLSPISFHDISWLHDKSKHYCTDCTRLITQHIVHASCLLKQSRHIHPEDWCDGAGATEESRQEVFRMMTLKALSKSIWCSGDWFHFVSISCHKKALSRFPLSWKRQLPFTGDQTWWSAKPSTSLAWQVFRPCLASDCLRQMSIRDIPWLKEKETLNMSHEEMTVLIQYHYQRQRIPLSMTIWCQELKVMDGTIRTLDSLPGLWPRDKFCHCMIQVTWRTLFW